MTNAALDHDPVLAAIAAAPTDDRPETPEERAAIEAGLADVRAGRLVGADVIEGRIAELRSGE